MSASQREIQDVADELLELLNVRLEAGQIVIHYSESRVQKVEINTVHRPKNGTARQPRLDTRTVAGA